MGEQLAPAALGYVTSDLLAFAFDTAHEQMADALDHIARTLSTIDHNLEALAVSVGAIAHQFPQLTRK